MKKLWRLSPRAERRLSEIADWTETTFGQSQANIYESKLLDTFAQIAAGTLQSRPASAIWNKGLQSDLRVALFGAHRIIFLDLPAEIVVTDILHHAMDTPDYMKS